MNGRIKTGFPILDDVLGGGVREGLLLLRCEGVPCAWVAERIVENLHRNAPGDDGVTTAREDAEQAMIVAHMTGRVAVAIRCGYEVTQETRYADLILTVKAVDGGYEVRVVKHRNGRIGGGVAMASSEGVLVELCALAAPSPENANLPPGGATMKDALGHIVELTKASEFLRWETAMRDVVTDIRAKATDYRTRADREGDGMVAMEFHIRAEECERIAEMLNHAIIREVNR